MQDERTVLWLRTYRWRIMGALGMLLIAILFLTLGFWKTMLIVGLSALGWGIGYMKDHSESVFLFLNRVFR
ncbi:DUF2273 domain-containing protein [Savagea sp. SN6]|uniref:DUF2273 domain-containing protein n=1 Tax=Savagea serpentis TaxID=2785297 RepID=A0A8J7GID9_9BACL|nr:DUF2273 domain-containing protein [Savagea serpentis]MBF4500375.1 DUF2273 domain-containing protein [Savagea serpentis]